MKNWLPLVFGAASWPWRACPADRRRRPGSRRRTYSPGRRCRYRSGRRTAARKRGLGGQPVAFGVVEVILRRQVHERVDRAGRLAVQQVDHDVAAVGGDRRLIGGGGVGRGGRRAHLARGRRVGQVAAVRGRFRGRGRRCRRGRRGRGDGRRGRGGRRGCGGVAAARPEEEITAHADPDDHAAHHADHRPQPRAPGPLRPPGLLALVTLTGELALAILSYPPPVLSSWLVVACLSAKLREWYRPVRGRDARCYRFAAGRADR